MDAPTFVADLAVVLVVASVTGLIFRRLRQPTVLGYLVAGLIVGPYIPIPVFADPERIHALSELGVVLVMFMVGLELRIRRLFAVLPAAGATTLIEVASLLGCGFGIGRLLGWDPRAALFLGASVAISSTMVVSKIFEDRAVREDIRRHVMSVLVIQDVLAIVLAALLTAIAAGEGLSTAGVVSVVGRLGLVLLTLLVVGLLVVPRLIRGVARAGSDELLVVVCMGLCFGLALAAEWLGYSVALGAFFAGALAAESGEGERIEHLASPLRDTFAAIFFVAIGMTVDPRVAIEHLDTSLLVTATVVLGQLLTVSIAGVLSGTGLRPSITAGLALGQVGEFGFILSAIGIEAGLAPASLGPIVVTVAVLTATTTPLTLRGADALVRRVDHLLPQKLQDVLSLYEAWFERLRRRDHAPRPALRRIGWVVALEGIATTAIVMASASLKPTLRAWVGEHLGLVAPWDQWAVILGTVLFAAVPGLAFVRATRAFGMEAAEQLFGPAPEEAARRPRRFLVVSVQLLVLFAVGIPCAVIALPVAGAWLALGLGVTVLVTAGVLWRTAGRVSPQVHFSAERLVDLLARHTDPAGGATTLPSEGILGLERAEGVVLEAQAHAVGKTLAELDLRASTGATVVALRRGDETHRLPGGEEPLAAGDVLALAGTSPAIARARTLLIDGPRA